VTLDRLSMTEVNLPTRTLTIGQMRKAKRDATLSIDTPTRDIHALLAADFDANLRDRRNA
jgi:hypothetical protein